MVTITKVFKGNFHKSDGVALVLTALLTAIASEIKVVPFNGEAFRFGLGSATFFLLILIRPPKSLLQTGFVTGLTVVGFRVLHDILIDHIQLLPSLKSHWPAFLFYFLFALGLSMIKLEQYKTFPLLLGAWATGFEFIGNGAEYITRYLLLDNVHLGLREWLLLIAVALFRSYFVVGLYSSIIVSEQKKRMEEMLEVGSELYAETQYLEKSLNHIEQVTASSHDLYRKLKKENLKELSVQALLIAQEIHEVKKDSQRILSGLSKINARKKEDHFLLSEVLNLVMTGNEKYSQLLKKNITFHLSSSTDFETDQQIPLLALFNNLTANAVESIVGEGKIDIIVYEEIEQFYFIIKDSGGGIPKEDMSVIFDPGYTTKFNDHGVAATGIGLPHVQEIIQTLEGQVHIDSSHEGTTFQVKMPTEKIRKRVE